MTPALERSRSCSSASQRRFARSRRSLARLIWNASASVPIGLYAMHTVGALHVGELVVVMPPEPLASFLAERRYLPRGVPLLKHVVALPGQTVCRNGLTITVDGVAMGEALDRDSRGRPLPVWHGCRVVADGEVFLMNWQSADSLDGRYFGPCPPPRSSAGPIHSGPRTARRSDHAVYAQFELGVFAAEPLNHSLFPAKSSRR